MINIVKFNEILLIILFLYKNFGIWKKLRFKNIFLIVMFINCLYIVNDVILMLIIILLYREGKELMKLENSSYYD